MVNGWIMQGKRFGALILMIALAVTESVAQSSVAQSSAVQSSPKNATDPGALVQQTVEAVREAVQQESGTLTPEQLDEKLREIIEPVFDFDEMSRRSLGANWKKGKPEQQQEFVKLFSDLLAKNYLKKIRENVADSTLSLVGEKKDAQGKRALVRTVVKYDGEEAAIDYRLRNKGQTWRIYDVVVENIGLVSNYRSEFGGILAKEDFEGLLQKLREKSIAPGPAAG